MIWRLTTQAPDLAERLDRASPAHLREVADRVSRLAIREVSLDGDDRIKCGMEALKSTRYGETVERGVVLDVAEELDEDAWTDREGDQANYLALFRKARAATAVWFALDKDPLNAAQEASYEALIATSEAAVRDVIEGVGRDGAP